MITYTTTDIIYLKQMDKSHFVETKDVVLYEQLDESVSELDPFFGEHQNLTFKTPVSIQAWLIFEEKGGGLDENQRAQSDYDLRALFTRQLLDEAGIVVKIQDRFTYSSTTYEVTQSKETDIIGNTGVFLRTEALCKRLKTLTTHPSKENVVL